MSEEFKLRVIDTYHVPAKGTAFVCRLPWDCNRDDLPNLVGTHFRGYPVLGIESFAIQKLSAGTPIAVLVDDDNKESEGFIV